MALGAFDDIQVRFCHRMLCNEDRAAFPETLHEKLFYGKPDGKYQLNLWEANHQILLAAGVPEKQIHLPNLCTCCNPDFLYSHRASKGKRGNLAAFLSLV